MQVFKHEILPGLRDVPLSIIARATGFSRGYCSFIRRGVRIPHPRHWEALRKIARTGDETGARLPTTLGPSSVNRV
jgi:hypothetical protein